MADEQTAQSAADDQRATDPRLEQTIEAAPIADAPEPAAETAPESAPAEGDAPAAEPAAEPKPKKDAVEVLKGRVGHLTKVVGAKDRELADALRRAAAAEALLSAGNRTAPAEGETPPAPPQAPVAPPAEGRVYTQAEFDSQVAAKAAADAFNQQADAMYDAGAGKFPDWKESVDMLNATGLMGKDLLDAAMATDDGAAVIHHLGGDIEEAQRIAALPPIRMAAELTKLATKLSAPTQVRVSAAPPPIGRIDGRVNPTVDLERASEGGNDMAAYREARAKQGARWAQPKGERQAR